MSFGKQKILENIDLDISKGESFVIVGGSGQGKTVLLKIMAGLILPNQGTVYVEGQQLSMLQGKEYKDLLKKVAMLFQKNALFDSLTCSENVAFPLREAAKVSEKEIEEKVSYFLEAVGLSHAKDLYPDEISGGMQKRLGIARALALDPEIVFYDDPTAGLDPITSRKIIDLIRELKTKNKATIVVITNDMNRAYQLEGRIGMVVGGSLVIAKNKKDALEHPDERLHHFIRGLKFEKESRDRIQESG